MADSKYGQYLVTIPFHKAGEGALFATGGDVLGGLDLNVIYACAYKTGITGLSTKPHVHNYDVQTAQNTIVHATRKHQHDFTVP